MCKAPSEYDFIKESIPKNKVYLMWLTQLDKLERSTIIVDFKESSKSFENSMDIGFKLFPLIDSIALNLLRKPNGRKYLEELGYSETESYLMCAIFRNGILHTTCPYRFVFENGVVNWSLFSSSGSDGFMPHFPGYLDKSDPSFNVPADKAFTFTKVGQGQFIAILSLDSLVAHIKYDLKDRQQKDHRATIDFVIGQKIKGKVPNES